MNGRMLIVNALERALQNPDSFKIPTHEELYRVNLGDYVKIILVPEGGRGERVWVQVTAIGVNVYEGVLDSIPLQSDLLPPRGSVISFFRNNICAIEKL